MNKNPLELKELTPDYATKSDSSSFASEASLTPQYEIIPYSGLAFSDTILHKSADQIIYKGAWEREDVVIKQLTCLDDKKSIIIKNQAAIMSRTTHLGENLVTLRGLVWEEKCHAMIFPYAANKDLSYWIGIGAQFTWQLCYLIAWRMACGLSRLHQRDIIHGNLKSSNVLFFRHFKVKLAGYGLPSAQRKDKIPIAKAKADDIDSLGSVLEELVRAQYVVNEQKDLLSSTEQEAWKEFKAIISQCKDKDPAQRPQAETLAAHLTHMLEYKKISFENPQLKIFLQPFSATDLWKLVLRKDFKESNIFDFYLKHNLITPQLLSSPFLVDKFLISEEFCDRQDIIPLDFMPDQTPLVFYLATTFPLLLIELKKKNILTVELLNIPMTDSDSQYFGGTALLSLASSLALNPTFYWTLLSWMETDFLDSKSYQSRWKSKCHPHYDANLACYLFPSLHYYNEINNPSHRKVIDTLRFIKSKVDFDINADFFRITSIISPVIQVYFAEWRHIEDCLAEGLITLDDIKQLPFILFEAIRCQKWDLYRKLVNSPHIPDKLLSYTDVQYFPNMNAVHLLAERKNLSELSNLFDKILKENEMIITSLLLPVVEHVIVYFRVRANLFNFLILQKQFTLVEKLTKFVNTQILLSRNSRGQSALSLLLSEKKFQLIVALLAAPLDPLQSVPWKFFSTHRLITYLSLNNQLEILQRFINLGIREPLSGAETCPTVREMFTRHSRVNFNSDIYDIITSDLHLEPERWKIQQEQRIKFYTIYVVLFCEEHSTKGIFMPAPLKWLILDYTLADLDGIPFPGPIYNDEKILKYMEEAKQIGTSNRTGLLNALTTSDAFFSENYPKAPSLTNEDDTGSKLTVHPG